MSNLSCGIVGLPNVGKSTFFNALTRNAAAVANYPFCTIDPNIGIVEVVDPRLAVLAKLSSSKKIVPATMTFIDIAGLVKGASQGEGLGNQFLSKIRETDAIVHVVRCFENDQVIHVSGKVDPIADIEVINLELILADLQTGSNILDKLEKQVKGKKELHPTICVIKKILEHLNCNHPLRTLQLSTEEIKIASSYTFLSSKKVLYVTNVSEQDLPSMENKYVEQVRAYATKEGNSVVSICASLEEAIVQLSFEEAAEYLATFGVKETGLHRLIHSAFEMLNLITYITTGEIETRGWTISKGTNAQAAAGKIHTDLEKGFIRAEVISYEDFVTYRSRVAVKEAGKARSEGKEYIVKDGDVILFYHN